MEWGDSVRLFKKTASEQRSYIILVVFMHVALYRLYYDEHSEGKLKKI